MENQQKKNIKLVQPDKESSKNALYQAEMSRKKKKFKYAPGCFDPGKDLCAFSGVPQ